MKIFDDYSRIAQQNGFLFEGNVDNRTFISPNDRVLNSKFCLLSKNDLIYFASDSYAAKVGMSSTYSGVYAAIPNGHFNLKAEIIKHFWYDFIAGRNTVKTNDSYIDKHLSIITNSVAQLMQIIDVRIVDSYLKLWEKYSPLKIVIGVDYLPSIKPFKDKVIIGIEKDEWILPDKFNETYNDLQEVVSEIMHRIN